MTDREYEILDELYFTMSFHQLCKELGSTEESVLLSDLVALIQKGWVKAMQPGIEAELEDIDFIEKHYKEINFLASKKGLLAHNSR
jgi:hypothetical protein